MGRPVIFDMDMSPGDFVSLIYLLKAPIEVINLKVQLVRMAQHCASMQ
jgi:inosine-uridine nucleoside N-ribohydrolase